MLRISTLLTTLLTVAIIAMALIAADLLTFGTAHATTPTRPDFDAQVLAKIAKAKASSRSTQRAARIGRRKAGVDCGSTSAAFSRNSSTGFGAAELTVPATGDVINADDTCR